MSTAPPATPAGPFTPPTNVRPTTNPPDTWECSLQLTNNPRAVRIVRHSVRIALLTYDVCQSAVETAELLTSELVGNAVKHADSPIYVRARARDGIVRVSVWDSHPELPEPLPLTTTDPFGRGLYLVHHLSHNWGRYSLDSDPSGKVTWFELTT
ncbi:ATP-binding protein [Streptomyces sp. P38-E01]|uniref:ATP-binding protein n=1 Tax=Streptomyces tardus TaxID=2780544 RepID=A0A949JHY1_9ACTN|nr:ATP-binding protein [Streptomyces tardus]MBU7596604.1 ATP-binding protein [Streptomyces tardus]